MKPEKVEDWNDGIERLPRTLLSISLFRSRLCVGPEDGMVKTLLQVMGCGFYQDKG